MTEHKLGECSICLSTLDFVNDKSTIIIKTECNHTFHYYCWKRNFDKGNEVAVKCPLCRERLAYEGQRMNDEEYILKLEAQVAEWIRLGNGSVRG